jgi:hypothetical protein
LLRAWSNEPAQSSPAVCLQAKDQELLGLGQNLDNLHDEMDR